MHEYGLMQNAIQNVLDQIKETPLNPNEKPSEISMVIGALEIHSEESFKGAFEMIMEETPELKGCKLNLTIHKGKIECECGYSGEVHPDEGDPHDATPVTSCPKCGKIVNILDGRGIREMELITVGE